MEYAYVYKISYFQEKTDKTKETKNQLLYEFVKNLVLVRDAAGEKFSYKVTKGKDELSGIRCWGGLDIRNTNQALQVKFLIRQWRIGSPKEQERMENSTERGHGRHSEIEENNVECYG